MNFEKELSKALNESVLNDPTKLESLKTLVSLASEHYQKRAKILEDLQKVLDNPKKSKKLVAELKLPDLEKGDVLLVGKFKNRKAEIKGFSTDDNGQPVADTTKGEQKIFKPRIEKLMPKKES